jgi:hypothetical protein
MNYLEKCLFNLDAVAKIPAHVRVNTRGDSISVEAESYVQWLWRLSDSRIKAFQRIKHHTSTAIELAARIMESKHFCQEGIPESRHERVIELKKIYNSLTGSKRGIENLQETYHDDNDAIALACDIIIEIDRSAASIKIFLRMIGEEL